MLTRPLASALLAVAIAGGGSTALAAPVPLDGSGECTGDACVFVAEDPGTAPSAAPVAKTSPAKSATLTAPEERKAWTPLTPEQLQRASAWDRHLEIVCGNAAASGQSPLPQECLPSAPAAGGGGAAPAVPQFTPGDATRKALSLLVPPVPAIGSAPCHEAGCKGAVGVPVWLWTQPWTTETATATAGPYTVTATATPTQVVWTLGDGQQITCTTPGTAYDLKYGFTDSPDCGARYQKVGNHALTATMTYRVDWRGADQGSDVVTTTSSVPVRIGEYQVVIKSNS